MPSINLLKLTAGLESVPGTSVARTAVIPISGLFSIQRTQEVAPDPAIVGANMKSGSYLLADDVGGNMALTPRPVDGYGRLLHALTGGGDAAVEVEGCIRVRYTGADASASISASASGDTIDSDTGVKGAEVADSNWGTAGSIDLTTVGTSIGTLVTEIDGYADYEAEKVFGADAVVTANIEDITALQGKNKWVYVWFTGTSGVYRHDFAVDLSNTERPTLTLQGDGLQDNYSWDGIAVDTMSISAALKAFAEGDATVLGFAETTGETVSALTLPAANPFVFHDGNISIAETDYTFPRNISLEARNNHNPDGYGQGQTGRQYHEKGLFEVSGEIQLRLDATSILERPKIFSNTEVAVALTFNGAALTSDIDEMMIVEVPYVSLDDWQHNENNGQVDATIQWSANNPPGAPYNSPFKVWLINGDNTDYSA